MSFHGTYALHGIRAFVSDLTYTADRELCMDQDEWAYRLGWTVTRTGFGARHYREPRFDLLRAERIAAPALALAPVPEEEVDGGVAA
ncbi:hypothetical protein [Streptosporangium sp. NBC_01756]|uniref:hypothetical protein n=1 Tax=Streptosporangium sp. NBC_01756 TaxID=2975950 RepID=UPI002DDC132F|nr:hypothetical protein [Streptosporangium sp. NBC_01756]WSC83001.1 hypothetical protein OIE48_21480 [Streptosporangium sp. NBC_01756]